MKKLLYIAVLAAFTFTSCGNNAKTATETTETEITQPEASQPVNQDSAIKAHGHSHDANGGHATAPAAAKQDSSKSAGVNQDSVDKAHGHKH
ncbi:hypothetical protein [Sphingobacterium sp. HSC-15S19]|uniref:hypothetical protein n=1 Tax=Sphingobacterium TaxID=28453 RepID=UPI003D1CA71A